MTNSFMYNLMFNKLLGRLATIYPRQFASYKVKQIMPLQDDDSIKLKNSNENPVAKSYNWLHDVAPGFPLNASKITIIHEPSVFYTTIIEKCRNARNRITLASLYLGTGALEGELVNTIRQSIATTNGKIKVNILLDYMRGSRGKNNSRKMLEPLLHDDCTENCQISLYHTPKIRGLLKAVIPHRFNELIGLQHMKVYIFDDSLIISGANLSNDYFTNRQDRYFLIEDCKELCDFYNELICQVSAFSYRLLPGGSTSHNTESGLDPVRTPTHQFTRVAREKILSFYANELKKRQQAVKSESDTWIFPLIQMGQLGIYHDSIVTLRLLQSAALGSTLRLATGYFNLTSEYVNALLNDCRASCHLLTAHPMANGFFGAKGVAGGIPAAYTRLEKTFYESCERLGKQEHIRLHEYARPKWTYHAKGLWYTLPGQSKPSLTFIGSSNFGYRSVKRDLETQIAVITENKRLQSDLESEYTRLYDNSKVVTKEILSQRDRAVPVWVCAIVLMFRYYF